MKPFPPPSRLWCPWRRVPLGGLPRCLARFGSGCPGPADAAASCLLRGLFLPVLQEESSRPNMSLSPSPLMSNVCYIQNG